MFRSGTEEDFNELQQLLEDIYKCKRDQDELKQREKNKKHMEQEEHQKALAMRSAALSGMASKFRSILKTFLVISFSIYSYF